MPTFISDAKLKEFLFHLSRKNDVYVPSGIRFEKLKKGTRITTNKKTRFSSKKILLPSKEEFFSYSNNEIKSNSSNIKALDTVLFGVRPCDLEAIRYMDKTLKKNPYYWEKRKKTILIGIQCDRIRKFRNCYCHYTDTLFSDNFDLILVPTTNGFAVQTGSKKGTKIIDFDYFSIKATDPKKMIDRLKRKYARKSGQPPKAFNKLNEKSIEEMSKRCLSCTACTQVCPSCQSFTIEDEPNIDLKSGTRIRLWDSCQLQDYTKIAGDIIFRPTRLQRTRQRIMCKLRYSLKREGLMSCTGCGRCVDVCPKDINMFEALK